MGDFGSRYRIAALGSGTCNLGPASTGTRHGGDGRHHGFNDLHPGTASIHQSSDDHRRVNILILSLVALLAPFPSYLGLPAWMYRSLYGMNAASPVNALTYGIYSIHRIRHASFHVISTSTSTPATQLLSRQGNRGVRKKPKSRSSSGIWNSVTLFLWFVGKTAGCSCLWVPVWKCKGRTRGKYVSLGRERETWLALAVS